MSNVHEIALQQIKESLDSYQEELRESANQIAKAHNMLVEEEVIRIGRLPVSEVTVAEQDFYQNYKQMYLVAAPTRGLDGAYR